MYNRNVDSIHQVTEGVLLVVAVVLFAFTGWEHLTGLFVSFPGGDATVFFREARRLANDWTTLGTTWDPLLRYVGLAVVYTVFGEGGIHIAAEYAVVVMYVVVPAAIYGFARVVTDRLAAAIALFLVGLALQFAIPLYGYATFQWQYPFVLPLLFGAFTAARFALRTGPEQLRWPAVTGVLLGLAGLQQFSLTAYAVAIVFIGYATRRRFRSLLVTGGIGGLFLLGLVVQPGDVVTHLFWYSDRFGELSWAGLQTSPEELWRTVSGGRHAVIFSWFGFVLLVWVRRGFGEVDPLLRTGVVVCALCWCTRFDSVAYYAESALMIGGPLLAVAAGEILSRRLRKKSSDYEIRSIVSG